MEKMPKFTDRKTQYIKMSVFPKLIYTFNSEVPRALFIKHNKLLLTHEQSKTAKLPRHYERKM